MIAGTQNEQRKSRKDGMKECECEYEGMRVFEV